MLKKKIAAYSLAFLLGIGGSVMLATPAPAQAAGWSDLLGSLLKLLESLVSDEVKTQGQKDRDAEAEDHQVWADTSTQVNAGRHAEAASAAAAAKNSEFQSAVAAGAAALNGTPMKDRTMQVYAAAGVNPGSNSPEDKKKMAASLTAASPLAIGGAGAPSAKVLASALVGVEGISLQTLDTREFALNQSKKFTSFARKQMAYQIVLASLGTEEQAANNELIKQYVAGAPDQTLAAMDRAHTVKEMYRMISGTNAMLMKLYEDEVDTTRLYSVMLAIMTDNFYATQGAGAAQ